MREAVPMPPLKPYNHAGTAAYGAFRDRAGLGRVQRRQGMLRFDVLAIGIIHRVKCFSHHGVGEDELAPASDLPVDGGIAHHSDTVRTGEENRAFQKAGFLNPVDPGHVAVAILIECGGHHEIPVAFGARENGRDAGANGAHAVHQFAFAFDDGGVAHGYAGNIGYGVVRSRGSLEGDTGGRRPRGFCAIVTLHASAASRIHFIGR